MRPFLLSQLLDEPRIEPSAPAVGDGTRTLSYGQLADRVARLAGALATAGVARGDRVGILLTKSVDSVVAVHGSLRAGAVHVPLDPLAPSTHIGRILADCGVKVVVTDSSLDRLSALAGLEVVIGPEEAPPGVTTISWNDVADHERAQPTPVLSGDPAYIIYTSGSTGEPKGIVHSHRSGLRYAELAADTYGLGPSDRMANLAPLHFDQSTFELYAAPLAGAMTFLVPDAVLRFPASLSEVVERQEITVWYSVPYLLLQLLHRGALDRRDLSSLRWVLYGGESFPPGALHELMTALPHARFSNVYGPAEVNQCTYYHLDVPPPSDDPVPIGRAWPDTEVAILGSDRQPVPAGEPGELWVRTETAMIGYWGRCELTQAAFRQVTTAGGLPQSWFATGDLVRQRPDGELVFVGRLDNQVKVRGHRVELEAVDRALCDLDGVGEAAVVCEDDDLVALVVTEEELDHRAVLSQLHSRLPGYSVPGRIIATDRLPRTATGKIDRPAAAALVAGSRSSGDLP